MYLTYRPIQVADLGACFSFAQARYPYVRNVRQDILSLWRELITSDGCIHLVVEDRDRPKGRRQVSFAIAFFATDGFMREARTTLPPFISQRAFEKWRCGRKPFPSKDDVFQAKFGQGVNVVKLNWGFDHVRYDVDAQSKIHRFLSESYQVLLAGHRLKEYLEEVYGTEEKERFLGLGCDVQRDYREFIGTKYMVNDNEETHPYLMGCVFAEVRKSKKKMETAVGKLALLGPPRFNFRPVEQQVLQKALQGETDEEIANCLEISLIAVKKRWQGIYGKVGEVDPELLGDFSGRDSGDNGRLRQRRRYLVKNLKDHPEELWPVQAPSKIKRKAG